VGSAGSTTPKAGELTTIGRFGVGFKSVYAYTTTPEIHSGEESFVIRHFVRPHAAARTPALAPGETLFVFPFDHPDVPADLACREIGAALLDLPPTVLLFLSSLTRVEASVKGATRVCTRNVNASVPRRVELGVVMGAQRTISVWWLFETPIEAGAAVPKPLQIAFRLAGPDKNPRVAPLTSSPLSVFFPTEKETGLGFLLQGPFRTTPARDNVPAADVWNRDLIRQAGEFVVRTLHELKALDLLTLEVLDAMPLQVEHRVDGSMFEPLHRRVANALRTEPLLPTEDGGYAPAERLRIARSGSLRRFLTEKDLGPMLGQHR
jgi:hypothetical protein